MTTKRELERKEQKLIKRNINFVSEKYFSFYFLAIAIFNY